MAARAITDTSSDPLHTVPNLPEKADVIRAHTFRETLALAGQTRRAEIAEQIAREAKRLKFSHQLTLVLQVQFIVIAHLRFKVRR